MAEGHQSARYAQAGAACGSSGWCTERMPREPIRHGADFLGETPGPGAARGLLGITKAQEEALAWQGTKDGNITKGCLLLAFIIIIDEDLCIVDGLGQEPVLMAKLCEVQTGRGKDKPRIPNGAVSV